MSRLTLHAPAKLNLYLHLLRRRADGYHELESLVAFAQWGDVLTIEAASTLSLTLAGEFAGEAGHGENNLVLKAAHALQAHSQTTYGAALCLTKNIPVGAGLGGGSADAAAALRGLNQFWQLGLDAETLSRMAARLGADVAMCLDSVPTLARGVGEILEPLPHPLPPLWAVLVHPRIPLLTKEVYAALEMPTDIPQWTPAMHSSGGFLASLRSTRNHLQYAAIRVSPVVAELLLALETIRPNANFVRMSGSGACCYALFEDEASAKKATTYIEKHYPDWWVNFSPLRCG